MECSNTHATVGASNRTRLRRLPDRGSFDRSELNEILDTAVICHVGFVHEGKPVVIPTIHARIDETLMIHGSAASRMLRTLAAGVDVCVTVTLVDGLVLSKSWFHHSVNYRSAVIFGVAALVSDPVRKEHALAAIVDHVNPGRTTASRPPTAKELAATSVLALPLTEFSVKRRSGGPVEDDADLDLPWTNGVVPVPAVRFGGGSVGS